jgi:hypothetical protein
MRKVSVTPLCTARCADHVRAAATSVVPIVYLQLWKQARKGCRIRSRKTSQIARRCAPSMASSVARNCARHKNAR